MRTKRIFSAIAGAMCGVLVFTACDKKPVDNGGNVELPKVMTVEPSSVKSSSVETGGNVSSDGGGTITDRGVCWSTSQNPTVDGDKKSEGSGKGAFICNITGLESGTTYYFRAYATNAAGTAYGQEYAATTKNAQPATLTTADVTNAYGEGADSGGEITNDGDSDITARGVCWSTSENPTVDDSKTVDGTGTGVFTSRMTGLTQGVTYYVKAYATNDSGTSYGNQLSFATQAAKAPTVTSKEVTEKTGTGAQSGGLVTDDGGAAVTVRGVCWSLSENPTVDDNKTTDGAGTGDFTSAITGLTEGNVYYLRAYATNSVGTSYGEERLFAPFYLDDGTSMVKVEGGTFTMGGDDGNGSSPQFRVTLPDFYLAKTEVTQKLFFEMMGSSYESKIDYPVGKDDYNPMPKVVWGEAIVLCNKLSLAKGYTPCYSLDGETDPDKWKKGEGWEGSLLCDWGVNGYRLPNMAEWEYAAGGGAEKRTVYAGTNDIEKLGLYGHVEGAVPGEGLFTVATRLPNQLGLYDMNGNATEWCWEWSYEYNSEPKTYPQDLPTYNYADGKKVKKGGSIWNWEQKVYMVYSNWTDDVRAENWPCGMRLARTKID